MQIQEWNSMHTIWGEKVHAIVCEIYLLNSTINFYGNWSVEFVQWATICGYYYFNRSLDQRIHFDINEFNLSIIIIYNFALRFFISILTSYFKRMTKLENTHFYNGDGWWVVGVKHFQKCKILSRKRVLFKIFFFHLQTAKNGGMFYSFFCLRFIIIFSLFFMKKKFITNKNKHKHLSCSCEIVKRWMNIFFFGFN